ncbi:NADH pyrophosphatase zinc ribbon domain-containing protein [Microbacterium sp. NIBRBAC000506063]|uniref:NADH pyrophosphatase zinc ribbon domain-containing protein n=1 Tax=Microbacterium sp. NIBRBAC000506063 TaxID=2734618 RepID=UPI001CB6ED93|nr:NADH pyrophosphatase zinc ribbon domain-containing protein [Microbacterium sp. NIBRBAC000506063]
MTILPAQPALLDRWNARRSEPGLLEALRADPATRVLLVHEGRARVTGGALVLVGPDDVPSDAAWALLGARADETPVLLAAVAEQAEDTDWEGGQWAGVREAATSLDAESAELLTSGVALAAWIRDAPFCPRCGATTELRAAGWSRCCTGCGREHFPRTDPAVIVAIASRDGERLLLGANALWKGGCSPASPVSSRRASRSSRACIARSRRRPACV